MSSYPEFTPASTYLRDRVKLHEDGIADAMREYRRQLYKAVELTLIFMRHNGYISATVPLSMHDTISVRLANGYIKNVKIHTLQYGYRMDTWYHRSPLKCPSAFHEVQLLLYSYGYHLVNEARGVIRLYTYPPNLAPLWHQLHKV